MNSKMKTYHYMAAAALMMAMAACGDDTALLAYDDNPNAVRVQPTVGGIAVSRTAPADDNRSTAFTAGDAIKVSRDGATFYQYDYSGTTWSPADGDAYLMWESPAETSMTLQAYYPADGASMTSFALPQDQSGTATDGSGDIADADYMTYSGTVTKGTDNTAAFTMRRHTARVRVTIDGFGDQYADDSQCDVRVCSPYSAITVTYSDAGEPTVEGSGAALLVTPLNGKGMKQSSVATALVVPSEATSGTFLEVDINGATLYVTGIPAHAAGYSYDYHLTVGKDAIVVNSVTVKPWVDTTVEGGTAEEKTDGPDASTHTIRTPEAGQIATNSGWITTAINGGTSLKIIGPMNDSDIEALKTYLVANPAAALELDLSKVTELTTFPYYGFSQYDNGSTLGLKSIVLPDVMTKIDGNAFRWHCSELESVTLPAGLKEIGGCAFFDCSKLSTIKVAGKETINELPEGLNTLKDAAFGGTKLETITIPSSLTTTTMWTLNGMASLKTVNWNSSAETPYECFAECSSLTDIYFTSETAPAIGTNIFGLLTQDITIHIPAKYEDNYSAWKALETNERGWNITCTTD